MTKTEKTFAMTGARDMLRESAKHFRAMKQFGHARMADIHADNLGDAIKALEYR